MVMPDKSRYVYLYLPSAEDKARWQKLADEAGVPLSKFVIEVVENTLSEESDFKPRGELVKEIGKLRSENKLLRDDVNQKKIVLEKYETELKRYRSQAFIENKFEHSPKLVDEVGESPTFVGVRKLDGECGRADHLLLVHIRIRTKKTKEKHLTTTK